MAEHVVFDGATGEMLCDHCGERCAISTSTPIRVWLLECDAFVKRHERCALSAPHAVVRLFQSFRDSLDARPGAMTPAEWLRSNDVGQSSLTIYAVMTGGRTPNPSSIPLDADDFGRCARLLRRFPEWRPRLPEVAVAHPEWARLIARWDELECIYRIERPTGRTPVLCRLMKDLRAVVRT